MGVISRFFPDPEKNRHIQGSLSAASIDGTHMGPYTPGGALSLAYHYTAGDEFTFRMPRGGIGALSEALVKALEANGGEVQYKAQVKRFLVEDGKIAGGEQLRHIVPSAEERNVLRYLQLRRQFFKACLYTPVFTCKENF